MNREKQKLFGIFVSCALLVSFLATGCQAATSSPKNGYDFSKPKKSAHFEGSTPEDGTILAATPTNVVIDFNFDLAPGSKISILRDGKEYGTGKTVVDKNKLAMRRDMDHAAPSGLYTVEYRAYWPDKSSHDGHFQFVIDKKKAGNYENLTGKKAVTIKLRNSSFQPKNIVVDKGTKVTWVNQDSVEHFVNTDSHPAHTYYPKQNSRGLDRGDKFSVTFTKPGVYPYHCSAHAGTMKAVIVVK